MNRKKKIAVLFGGCSSEYEISLQSASAVLANIDREKYEAVPIGIAPDGKWYFYEGKHLAQGEKVLSGSRFTGQKPARAAGVWQKGTGNHRVAARCSVSGIAWQKRRGRHGAGRL